MLFLGSGDGELLHVAQLGTGWSGYDLIAGAGDLDGDGIADLVARDTAGRLWLLPRHRQRGARRAACRCPVTGAATT